MVPSKVTVPPGWIQSRFTELAVRNSSGQIPKAAKSTYQIRGRFPVVDQGQEMVAGYVDDEDLRFRGQLPVIVFGDHTRIFKYVDFPFVAGADGTRIITPRLARLDALFFYYALCNLPLTSLGYSRHFKLLKEQIIQYPRYLHEQRKIAAILSSVDDTIEKTRAVIDQAQIVKRGLMQELFAPNLPTGADPSEWIEVCLGDLFTLQLGKMLNRKARETLPRFPYLGNKDLHWGRFDFSSLRKMHFNDEERDRYRLLPGDLLVCEGGEVGRTAIWSGGFDCYYQKAIHRLRVRDSAIVEPRFIMHFMRFAAANRMFSDLTSQSSIAHLTREKLLLLKVPLPSLLEQRKIAAILSSVDDTIEENQTVMDRLRILKTALMSTLLTGELRVTPAPDAA